MLLWKISGGGLSQTRKKIHSRRWDVVTNTKLDGGLGFKELQSFNLALFFKMVVRVIAEPSAPWVRILRGMYFSNEDFFRAVKGGCASWIWSSWIDGRAIVMREGLWIIGDGMSARFYKDAWIPNRETHRITTAPNIDILVNTKVTGFIDPWRRPWREDEIQLATSEEELCHIMKAPIPLSTYSNTFLWPQTRDGGVSARSSYPLI